MDASSAGAAAAVFLLAVLLIFAILDLVMIVSLVRPGDERNQMIVWKASAYTLLATSGALILDIAVNYIRAEEMAINPLIHLETTAIVYFIALLYFRKRHGA